MQATKKPHNYHKTVVWQKDDRIRKSPLKFCVYYCSELSGDCQVSIFTELWRLSVAFCVTLWHMSIKSGKHAGNTAKKVLEGGKADRLLYLKGNTKGGVEGKIITIPIYLLESIHF